MIDNLDIAHWAMLDGAALCLFTLTALAVWDKPKLVAWRAGVAKTWERRTHKAAHCPEAVVELTAYGRHAWNGTAKRNMTYLVRQTGMATHRMATRLNTWDTAVGVKIT